MKEEVERGGTWALERKEDVFCMKHGGITMADKQLTELFLDSREVFIST